MLDPKIAQVCRSERATPALRRPSGDRHSRVLRPGSNSWQSAGLLGLVTLGSSPTAHVVPVGSFGLQRHFTGSRVHRMKTLHRSTVRGLYPPQGSPWGATKLVTVVPCLCRALGLPALPAAETIAPAIQSRSDRRRIAILYMVTTRSRLCNWSGKLLGSGCRRRVSVRRQSLSLL